MNMDKSNLPAFIYSHYIKIKCATFNLVLMYERIDYHE